MKSLDEESRVFAWGQVYRWSTVIGAILGGIPAIYYFNDIWGPQSLRGGLGRDETFRVIIQLITTAIVLLAVPVGAMCGSALAALLHVIWYIVNGIEGIEISRSSRRMSLSDEERRAFETELRQAEAEGKEVWTRK